MSEPRHNLPFDARFELLEALPGISTALPMLVRVLVHNCGQQPWSHQGPTPVNLAYHWYDADGALVEFDGVRTLLHRPVHPGESIELEMLIEPPETAGDYVLALDMVQESVGWFSQQGAEMLRLPLSVAPTPQAKRVCIVNGNCSINDALGNTVINQLNFFLARSYHTLVLVETLDLRLPAALRRYMVCISRDQLRKQESTPITRRAIAHFQQSDIFVYNYSTYYPLAETIELVSRGVTIFDYHGVTPPALWEGVGLEDLVRGQQAVELVRYADYAIAHSAYTRDELIATHLISPERVFQVALPVDLRTIRPKHTSSTLLQRYGVADRHPLLLYVGRMAANKRISDLVRALPLIRAQLPDATLVLVGDNRSPAYVPLVEQAQALAAQLGVADAVRFTGPVLDEELAEWYAQADLFVTASLHEGFCVPVIEALANGLPVVGSHITALPETIGDGGLTFSPGDPNDLAEKVIQVFQK
jgi:glycosyltransferase involved in cell wall biosynthesis